MSLDNDFSQDFPYKDRIYLNNASTSKMPRKSIQAIDDFLEKYNELGPDSETADRYVRERLSNLRKAVRASPHFFNTESEILSVIDAIKQN